MLIESRDQPDNYFQDIEQAAFSPSNMVPGIGPSADMGE
jgi:catalase